MVVVKLFYLLLIAGMSLFFILYVDPLSLIMLITVLLLPIVLWLLSLIAKLGTSIDVDVDRTVLQKGSAATLRFTVDNRTPISVTCIRLFVTHENTFCGGVKTEQIVFPAPARKKSRIDCQLSSAHCGTLHVEVTRALFYDFFRLWCYRRKLGRTFELTFIPELRPIDAALNLNGAATFDADTFSKTKSGDDPSEVFKIRDYQGGDKLNRIHWKLSVKQDTLLVKEYSLPINHAIVLLLEFNPPPVADVMRFVDGVIESASALSGFLLENETAHTIAWYDSAAGGYRRRAIESQEDLFETIGLLLQSRLYQDQTPALEAFTERRVLERCSHLLYFTPSIDAAQMEKLHDPNLRFAKTVVLISEQASPAEAELQNEVNLVTVSPENIGEGLYHLTI